MLREKSNNTALTNWLKQHSSQSTSNANNNENSMTEEEELQRAIQQSTAEYQAQQKLDYDLVSKSKRSTIFGDLPRIDDDDGDDDDQWFQTVSPRRIKREKRLPSKHASSKRKRNNTKDTPTPTPTTKTITPKETDRQQQQQQQNRTPEKPIITEINDTYAPLRSIKAEDNDWEICDDTEQTQHDTDFTQVRLSKSSTAKKSIQLQQTQPLSGSVMEPLSTMKENGTTIPFGHIKEEESWEICDDSQQRQREDDDWEIGDNTDQMKEESWEINDDDTHSRDDDDNDDNDNENHNKTIDSLTINNRNTQPVTRRSTRINSSNKVVIASDTQQGDDLQQYVSAIRNRNTKTVILPSSTSASTSANNQIKQPATQLDDVFNVFKRHRKTITMRKPIDPSNNRPSTYQSSFDRHGTLTSHTVDTVENYLLTAACNSGKQSGHSPTLVNETAFSGRPNPSAIINQSEQQLRDNDQWDSDSDCSSIIDLCADGVVDMDMTTSPDRAPSTSLNGNNNEDLGVFFDDFADADDELYNNNYLDTTYDDDDDITDRWATTMDDNDLIIVENNTIDTSTTTPSASSPSPPPPLSFLPSNTAASRNNNDTYHQIQDGDDDDDGYLSPLEGFTSLLNRSHTSADYRPFFDQLTTSARQPSSTSSSRRAESSSRRGHSSSRLNTSRTNGSRSRSRGGRERYSRRGS